MTPPESTPNPLPTRHLKAAERKVFDRVLSQFVHLTVADAEQITQYAETVVRYEQAVKETKRHNTVSIPVVNRSTGNITGEKIVRNPAYVTVRESSAQMTSLARRLMIDATSADKRQRLLSKKARAMAAAETKSAADNSLAISSEMIEAEIQKLIADGTRYTPEGLRSHAIWRLETWYPSLNEEDPLNLLDALHAPGQ